jgi:hypothetical protein
VLELKHRRVYIFDILCSLNLTSVFRYVVPKPRSECSKGEQLVVTFAAGYIAGVFCAIVSHPADTVVSKLNQEKGSTAIEAAKKLGFAGKMTVYICKVVYHSISISFFHCFCNLNLSVKALTILAA